MNVMDALWAHAQWKIDLGAYLKNPDWSIKPTEVGSDKRCELGTWINDRSAACAAIPEFAALRAAHTRFHRAAARVVRTATVTKSATANRALGPSSEFGAASLSVVNNLKALVTKIP